MIKLPLFIYTHRPSESAAALVAALPCYRLDAEGPRSRAGRRLLLRQHKVINWGSSLYSSFSLNMSANVKLATSKLKTLAILNDASVPALEATSDVDVAAQWCSNGTILGRKDGLSGGRGIVKLTIDNWDADESDPDFWVKYWKKTHEYRVHVFKGRVIDTQQKRRRTDWTGNYDPMIRNFDNGWVFCHDNIYGTAEQLALMGETAVKAVSALGLDFGAVDVLARFKTGTVLHSHAVCEINTAPGLEGQTLDKYVQAIRAFVSNANGV